MSRPRTTENNAATRFLTTPEAIADLWPEVTELEAYHQLSAYTLTLGDAAFIHQHVVDAYAAQNANTETKPITITFALVGLYLHIERQLNGREVQRAHQWLARKPRAWPCFVLPEKRGAFTAKDVLAYPVGAERAVAVSSWATNVWEAVAAAEPDTAKMIREICRPLPILQRA